MIVKYRGVPIAEISVKGYSTEEVEAMFNDSLVSVSTNSEEGDVELTKRAPRSVRKRAEEIDNA